MSRHLDIADAVVKALNGHTFSQGFTAMRAYRPVRRRENLAALTVTVIPAGFTTEIADRTRRQSRYSVDVALQRSVKPDSLVECDAVYELKEEVEAFFAMKRLDGLQQAIWEKVETVAGAEAGYAYEHLESLNLFTVIIRLTFKVIEA